MMQQDATRDVEPLVKDSISLDATKWTRMAKHCKGVSEETTTGTLRRQGQSLTHEEGNAFASKELERLHKRC